MKVENNGTVTVTGGNLYISPQTDATNNAVVVSGGSLTVTNSTRSAIVDVGRSGQGSFTLNSGTVTADRLLVRGGANSTFVFNGGALNITGTNVANNSQINNGATFTVGDGTHAATLNLGAGASFSVGNGLQISSNAYLTGTGSVTGGNTSNYGTISPGQSPGALLFTANLTLTSSSVLAMEIGGRLAGQFDQVIVTNGGAFIVNGALNISLINGFDPANGDQFHLLDFTGASSTSGVFTAVNLPALDPGLSWDTSQLLSTGYIDVVPEPSSLMLAIGGCLLVVLNNHRRRR
jgi:hypothetical protein